MHDWCMIRAIMIPESGRKSAFSARCGYIGRRTLDSHACRRQAGKECRMGKGHVTIFCGGGKGKTSAALGQGIFEASAGKSVIIIQFLKGKMGERIDFIKRLEPEIKVFCFEKSEKDYQSLSPEEQQEEVMNIKNGLNFARKVLTTDGCDILILDEVLGLVDKGIITLEELLALIEAGDGDTELVLTGIQMFDELYPYADDVFRINTLK